MINDAGVEDTTWAVMVKVICDFAALKAGKFEERPRYVGMYESLSEGVVEIDFTQRGRKSPCCSQDSELQR